MNKLISLSLALLIAGCDPGNLSPKSDVDDKVDEPAIVPVTEKQVAEENRRLDELDEPAESQIAILDMFSQATARYHGKPFVVFMAGTDSMNGGVDGWRTCAKLTPERFGLPTGTLVVFFDENSEPCDNNGIKYKKWSLKTQFHG